MFINKDILVHHISKYTNIKSTYNLFTTCKDLYKHINEVLNLNICFISLNELNNTIKDTRALQVTNVLKNLDNLKVLDELKLIEILCLSIGDRVNTDINIPYENILDLSIDIFNHNIIFNSKHLLVHDALNTLNVLSVDDSSFKLNNLSLPSTLRILRIDNLSFDDDITFQMFIDYLHDNCLELSYLSISYYVTSYFDTDYNKPIVIRDFNNLHKLEIRTRNIIRVESMSKLRELTVMTNQSISIKDLNNLKICKLQVTSNAQLFNLPSLRSITLIGSLNVICANVPNIEYVVLKSIKTFSNIIYNSVLFNNVNTILLVDCSYDMCYKYLLRYVDTLKKLVICDDMRRVIDTLVIKEYNNLEKLEIHVRCKRGIKRRYVDIEIRDIPTLDKIEVLHFYDSIDNRNKYMKDFNVSKDDKIIRNVKHDDTYIVI